MKAKTHKLADELCSTVGQLFRKSPEYDTILQAVAILVARVAQSTPDRGTEYAALNSIYITALEALPLFLNDEKDDGHLKTEAIKKGISAFSEMVRDNEANEDAWDQWGAGGPMAAKHLDPDMSWTPDEEEAHREVESPDGPRAYAP